jgi:hypothetical protein
LALIATALAAVVGVVVPTAPATAATSYGALSITGAVRVSYSIAGLCNYHATVLTSVTLRTQVSNGTTLAIAGSAAPPPGPINLATTSAFNVEVQIVSGPGAGGSWLAGYAGPAHLGSGSLAMAPSASFGSVEATLEPFGGGTIDQPIQLNASWNCAGEASPATTVPPPTGTSPASRLMSHVPSSYFGCTSNPELDLGGESIIFRYKAIAEVDCQVDGVLGVSLVIYTLYPNNKAMDAAFEHIWVDDVARPKASLGCPLKAFATSVCYYRIGSSRTTAGQFMRFLLRYPADPNPTPSITWTSYRYGIIAYLAGADSNDTQAVLDYWTSGAPGPV